jgi:Icc-related predicted phosphoesterase
MIVDCISDLHGYYPELPGGDILILAGDYTSKGGIFDWGQFFHWVKEQKYEDKIIIGGNHDNLIYDCLPKNRQEMDELDSVREMLNEEKDDFYYLCDSGIEINGLKIWGTPRTPIFDSVNPKASYFMSTESILNRKFASIPKNLDILITHGPMRGVLDQNIHGSRCGSLSLLRHIKRAKPKYFVFGHIHECGGSELLYHHEDDSITYCINCSHVDQYYRPKNSHVRLTIT